MTQPRISLIAILGAETRVIAREDGAIPWRIKDDLARFKRLTTGHPVIMGRKTWDSLGKYKPLPGRTNIVLTRHPTHLEGAECMTNLALALGSAADAPGGEEIFVIGGGEIYAEALHLADRLYLTCVEDNDVRFGDVLFPPFPGFGKVVGSEEHPEHDPPYTYLTLERG